jgi:Mu-like prophage I protein
MTKKAEKPIVREELSVIPSPDSEWVELARNRRTQGRLFEKHILNKGVLIHPATHAEINIDDAFVAQLKRNFDNGVCDIVQAPLADDQNRHSEAPDRNTGEIIDIRERDGKVYAVLDSRKYSDDLGKTLLGASAMLSTNYTDTRTGEKVGPTLLHVAITNRPYVTGLEDYKELVAASNSSENTEVVVYSSSPDSEDPENAEVATPTEPETEEISAPADYLNDETLQASTPNKETPMTRDELIAALLEEHGIDVTGLQAQAQEAETATELSNQLAEKLAETLELSNADSVDTATIIGAIAQVAQEKTELSNRVVGLEKAQAKHVVTGLVEAGFLLPTQAESFIELRLTNPDMFEKLIPAEPIVRLTAMVGQEQTPADKNADLDIDAEVARYVGQLGK